MIRFFYHPTPNPSKVALFLEESGLDYTLVPVDTSRGEQHRAEYLAINPNGKLPALIDEAVTIFDSSAILLYLGRKTGMFMGDATPTADAELLSWLMLIGTGLGPFTGQAVHFAHYAPKPNAYAEHRYTFEAHRHWALMEARLADRSWLLGASYSIVDMALWGWCRGLLYLLGDTAWEQYPNIGRLYARISQRPAAQRVEALSSRHAFKTEFDEETRASLFQHGLPVSV